MLVCSDFSQVMDSLWVTKEKTSTLLPPQTGFFFSKKELSKITVMQKDACRANTGTMAFSLLSYSHFERLDLFVLLSVNFFEVLFWQKFTTDVWLYFLVVCLYLTRDFTFTKGHIRDGALIFEMVCTDTWRTAFGGREFKTSGKPLCLRSWGCLSLDRVICGALCQLTIVKCLWPFC